MAEFSFEGGRFECCRGILAQLRVAARENRSNFLKECGLREMNWHHLHSGIKLAPMQSKSRSYPDGPVVLSRLWS